MAATGNRWASKLEPIFGSQEMGLMKNWLIEERNTKKIWPIPDDIFRAFSICPYDDIKIVILGQDPYPKPNIADGLAFSSRAKETPKSLQVIFREIYNDLNIQQNHNITYNEFFPSNNLENWGKAGVLLLNTTLTVEEDKPGSHKGKWNYFIESIINILNRHEKRLVFLLWGKEAQEYKHRINQDFGRHVVFEAPHPVAELYQDNSKKTFTGCRHFSIARDIVPMLQGEKVKDYANMTEFFDKEKAKVVIEKDYPVQSEELTKFIDNELNVYLWVNRQEYYDKLRQFELSLSTKQL